MYKQMKKQRKKKLFLKDSVQDRKMDSKQFKTATGSPILYTKFKKNKGIYYPLAKHHIRIKPRPQHSHKHVAVVNSRTYGREVYTNIDIWPDDNIARERLLEKLKGLSLSDEDDVGVDIPKETAKAEEIKAYQSTEDSLQTKTPDDIRHVTITVTDTSEDEDSPSSGDKQIHPDPDRPRSPPEDQGNWPLKRSHSIDSRDNPFLPGGDLSKEADDILKKATIIRDTFILKDEINAAKRARDQEVRKADVDKTESENQTSVNQSPVNESITQQTVSNTENAVVQNASPTNTRPKENGQVDTDNSLTPGSVAVEITDDNKNKKKQQKCCIVM
ncbi:uncharacterized protein LOC123525765 isoform X2 [Mercenaria mercenaria]|uniref:uncharacterized protein LOC123525765 isoform X2 n=1 Tax=Mercenaria mercenaria TaxID=6596 RepID=UPI00234F612F|nr:uncharacterized protein LOC123525765 isoform X2 [Mercenaria mercenaria]XP_053394453.1 uncharacterized protein LOC123525765 isoform X2 [Mercenaria mercenaria]XP_053394454.1 uncharacterized protein LOC123525765 isoform X2 [Mercenaria mercenaria]XP_053394455.1 uncharacterized protein LOC123525765 isoform X2 [Mercenaria mercenaria]